MNCLQKSKDTRGDLTLFPLLVNGSTYLALYLPTEGRPGMIHDDGDISSDRGVEGDVSIAFFHRKSPVQKTPRLHTMSDYIQCQPQLLSGDSDTGSGYIQWSL